MKSNAANSQNNPLQISEIQHEFSLGSLHQFSVNSVRLITMDSDKGSFIIKNIREKGDIVKMKNSLL